MSLAQVADLAYVELVDQVEARAATDRIVTAVVLAAGGTADLVDPDERRAAFDEALEAEPKTIDPDRRALLRELGVG